jgi:RecB family exonuclease
MAGTATFTFRVCGLAGLTHADAPPVAASAAPLAAPVAPAVVAPRVLEPAAPHVLAATAVAAEMAADLPGADPVSVARTSRSERTLGVAIHRMFQRRVAGDLADDELVAAAAAALDSPDSNNSNDEQDPSEQEAHAREAARLYRIFRGRPDVEAILSAGDCFYEVPFSYVPPDRPADQIRGVIDCLVVRPDGHVMVVEFKTGRERPEHAAQAALYDAAVRSALPEAAGVEVRILYS